MADTIALQNPLILEGIFSNLRAQDLFHCRQVCQSWETIATTILPYKIHEIEIQFKVPDLPKYITYIDANPLFRYTNFTFVLAKMQMTKEVVTNFFSKCGQEMTSLKLRWSHSHELGNVDSSSDDEGTATEAELIAKCGTALRKILIKCPNLVHLVIHSLPQRFGKCSLLTVAERGSQSLTQLEMKKLETLEIKEDCRFGRDLMRDLFLLCPNLKSVTSTSDLRCVVGAERDKIILDSLFRANRFDTLEHLALSHTDHELVQQLETNKNRLRLKSLKLNTVYPIGAEQPLFAFLSSQCTSLEKLLIWFTPIKFMASPSGNGDPIIFPVMEKLTIFGLAVGDVDIFRMGVEEIKFAEMDIPQQFPRLERLLLPESFVSDYFSKFFGHWVGSAKTVKELALPSGINREMMGRIGEMFPNVCRLTLGYQTDDVVAQIWTLWPHLESLFWCVNNGQDDHEEIMDGIVYGLDSLELLQGIDCGIQEENKPIRDGIDERNSLVESISTLKNIRKLRIHSGSAKKYKAISSEAIPELMSSFPYADIVIGDEKIECKMCGGGEERFWK